MCGTPDTPDEELPTAADIAELNAASLAHAQYKDVYEPLEKQAIAEATAQNRQDEQARFRGLRSADVAISESKMRSPEQMAVAINQGQGSLHSNNTAQNVAVAQSKALGEADRLAQDRFIDKKTSIVQTGRNMKRIADKGLRSTAQDAQSTAINNMINRHSEQQSKLAATAEIINGGLKAGMTYYGLRDQNPGVTPINSTKLDKTPDGRMVDTTPTGLSSEFYETHV